MTYIAIQEQLDRQHGRLDGEGQGRPISGRSSIYVVGRCYNLLQKIPRFGGNQVGNVQCIGTQVYQNQIVFEKIKQVSSH